MKTMDKKIHEITDYRPPIGVVISSGTSANKASIGLRKLEKIYGIINPESQVNIAAIDASGITNTFPVPMLDDSQQHQTLGPNENLPCPLHDSESLQKAEKNGDLWFMPPDWYLKPGVAKDNAGSGGNPRTGNALGIININDLTKKIRNKLRLCQDYSKQREILCSSEDEKIANASVTVLVCISSLGGFGNGNVYTILKVLHKLQSELELKMKIVLLVMTMGTLEPIDKIAAARNQEMLLRQLDSCMIGQFKDIQDKSSTMRALCDSMLLFSNVNNFGETNSIDKVISHVSNYMFTLFHTTLGNQILEKWVDIEESWPDEENGGKSWASTAAITKIHLDTPRIIKCVSYKLLEIFFNRILLDNHINQAHKEADLICAQQMLEEKGAKNLAFQRLVRPEINGSTDVIDDTIRVFHDRSGSRSGYEGCCNLANSSRYILSIHLQRNVNTLISRQAELTAENVKKALHNSTITHLQRTDGLSFTRQFLEAVSANIISYTEANAKKLNNAQAIKKSIDDRLSIGHTLIKKLGSRNSIFRFFSFGVKRKCREIFTFQTEQAIKTAVEIKIRAELTNEVYPSILEFVSEKLKTVRNACEKALEIKNDVQIEAKRLENFNPLLLVPIGLELADAKLINANFNHAVEIEGGTDKVFSKIFGEFQSNFANLAAFNLYGDQIKDVLFDYCLGLTNTRLKGLNVIDALEEYAPTAAEKNRLIDQAIRESSGSVRTAGEGGRSIPTMKFIGAGDCTRIQWLEKMTDSIDKTSGQWKSFETGDKNTIIFFQQRSQVSVSRIIKWTSGLWQKPENFEEFIKLSSSPVMAFAPTSCDSPEQLKTIAAMGVAIEVIENINKSENLYLNDSNNLSCMDFEHTMAKLQSNLPLRVDIYRQFVIDVAIDYKRIVSKLNSLVQYADNNDHDFFEKMGDENFIRAINIAKVIYPHLSRLPKDIIEWLKRQNLKHSNYI
jgi:hypothetical protein